MSLYPDITDASITQRTGLLTQRTARAAYPKKRNHIPEYVVIRQSVSEDYAEIENFFMQSNHLYPEIQEWWRKRVLPGIASRQRVALVVDGENGLGGVFIGKLGKHAKVCTLRLNDAIRRQGFGTALMASGLKYLLSPGTEDVHVTISESADSNCIPFFHNIGFNVKEIQKDRYVDGVAELVYSCQAEQLSIFLRNNLSSIVENGLFGVHPKRRKHMARKTGPILMSLRPEFADLFLAGRKKVEFRRKFSKRHKGAAIVFYVSSPVRRFVFTGMISHVDEAHPQDLWSVHAESGAISKETFDGYFSGTQCGYAITLGHIKPLSEQMSLESAKKMLPGLRPPQSFQIMEGGSPLLKFLQVSA